jgi:hypothetical protein
MIVSFKGQETYLKPGAIHQNRFHSFNGEILMDLRHKI